jgi:hypothetical protein
MAQNFEAGAPVNLAASGAISLTPGNLLGFYVNSTSSGTIALTHGSTSGGAAISGTITPAIGFHRFPAYCPSGLYATVGGTLNVTFFFAAG